MSNYKIKVNVEIVECNGQYGKAAKEQDDGSFTMIIDEKDAISIDNSERALLSTAYPAIRKALAEHLEKVSKKKSLKKPRSKKSK
jgi:bifunctional N-acetylglucosamine-1-phosphate-uridyltransferase/glucosamine-1-phosphate-acetyltransferase GlmU-like protein